MAYLKSLFKTNFLEYASYVIKERAIPHIDDGLKPVQRRIMHTLFEISDGNFHKVANVVGSAMRYHPHGDASIYSALVNIANREMFIDKQGNFGNLFTGDEASAARYIECRLTDLAFETMYFPEITQYEPSYDGRNKEPIVFPAKLPVLLAQGAEGIAVGMATKILPHNLIELMRAEIKALEGKSFKVYPDFQTGGEMDVSDYDNGNGKVLVRAKMDISDNKKIVIKELPFGVTTESLVASIESAVKKNKIKVNQISDYTTDTVEVEIKMPRGVNSSDMVDALYAFTDCQVSISCALLLIKDNQPVVMNTKDVIKHNANRLIEILKAELEIEQAKLENKLHAKTLEQIFIENRVYKLIETEKTSTGVLKAVVDGLLPFEAQIKRPVTKDDVDTLLKIPIRRISLYDIEKANREMKDINDRLDEIAKCLQDLVGYAIDFLKGMIEKYKKSFPRRTKVAEIEEVDAKEVAKRDIKLRYDKKTGYLGSGVSSGEVLLEVSAYDRILIIRKSGIYQVIDVPDKVFVDKGLLFCGFINPKTVFNIVYKLKKTAQVYLKRCQIEKFILNKSYELIPEDASVVAFNVEDNFEVELIYKPKPRLQVTDERFAIADFAIKGNKAKGVRLSTKEVKSAKFVKIGAPKPKKSSDGQQSLF